MLQLIEHKQNHLDWRTAYGTAAVHCCVTVSVQLVQNRECPHGTRATPVRAAMRHTWQVSSHRLPASQVSACDVIGLARCMRYMLHSYLLTIYNVNCSVLKCTFVMKSFLRNYSNRGNLDGLLGCIAHVISVRRTEHTEHRIF